MNRNSIYIKVILDSIRKANLNHPEGEKSLIIDSLVIKNINTFNNTQSELSLSQSTKLSYIGITFNNSYLTMNMFINAEKPKPVKCEKCNENGYIEYVLTPFSLLSPYQNAIPFDYSVTITIKESEKKIFERYAFPLPEGSLQALLEDSAELTAEQIAEIREGYIEKLTDPEKKADAYMQLQAKSPYHSQRDNLGKPTKQDCPVVKDKNNNILKDKDGNDSIKCSEPQDVADRMCNLTSVAMAFELLGISRDDVISMVEKEITLPDDTKNADMEDILDYFRDQKELGNRTWYSTWDIIAKKFNLTSIPVEINSSKKGKQQISVIKDHLKKGRAVLVSFFLIKGHIVRVQDIDETKITIDDPYGEVGNMAKRDMPGIDNRKGDYTTNKGKNDKRNKSGTSGQDVELTWDEIDIAIEAGRGGNVEHEDTDKFRDIFDPYKIPDSDYLTDTRIIDEPDKDKPEGTEIKYILWKGGTIKTYKIYYKK
jgi:hypothetical protein